MAPTSPTRGGRGLTGPAGSSTASAPCDLIARVQLRDEVTVFYDPADPTRAALEGKFGGGVLGVMFLVMGLLFATIGLIVGGIALLVTDRL